MLLLILNLLVLFWGFCVCYVLLVFFCKLSFNLVVNVTVMHVINLNEFCSSLLTRVALFNKYSES